MLTKYKKTVLAIGLTSLCGLFFLGVFVLSEKSEDSQAPIRSLVVTIDPSQRDEFFNQLNNFANKHAFEYNLTDYGGQGKYFLVSIWGDGIKILTVGVPDDSNIFTISFYAPSPGDPLPDEEFVNNLVVDLMNFLDEIPNIIVTEDLE